MRVAVLAHVVDDDDVGMAQRRRRPRFLLKAQDELIVVGEIVWQHLECDVAVERRLVRFIDGRHAAFPSQLDDLILSQCLAD